MSPLSLTSPQTKRATKGCLSEFVSITNEKTRYITAGRTLDFPKSSIIVFDRFYTDYAWYTQLTINNVFFVTHFKTNANYRFLERRNISSNKGITTDQTINYTGLQSRKKYTVPLRRIGYRDPEAEKHYVYLTNHFQFSAKTIADINKQQWQIELLFKRIKQNLKIKSFMGTTKNAFLTQIWIAMCVYLLIAFFEFQSNLTNSMQNILRLFQLNLFEKRDLLHLVRNDLPHNNHTNPYKKVFKF